MKNVLIAIAVIQAGMFALIGISLIRWLESQDALRDSLVNEKVCRQLAAEIRGLRQLGSVAQERQPEPTFGNAALLEIAAKCRINEGQVRSIQRIPSERVPETDYLQQGISVQLYNVTLFQVAKFALECERLTGSPKATMIRLSATSNRPLTRETGQSSARVEFWSAELILTQLVYDATSKSIRPTGDGEFLAKSALQSNSLPITNVASYGPNTNERQQSCSRCSRSTQSFEAALIALLQICEL